MRQTGGSAFGEISTKSKPASPALRNASGTLTTPTWLPSASMRRISFALMASFTLVALLMDYSSEDILPKFAVSAFIKSVNASTLIAPKSLPSLVRTATC